MTETVYGAFLPASQEIVGDPGQIHGWSEIMLQQSFVDMVNHVNLTSVAQITSDRRSQRLTSLDLYRFVPVTGVPEKESSFIARDNCTVPPDVEVNCDYPWCNPGQAYLDTNYGVGLVYQDTLCGLAGACIAGAIGSAEEKAILLKQIQGVTTVASNETKDGSRSGLREGLLWRETLVGAWMKIASQMGINQIQILSGHSSRWNHPDVYPERTERLIAGYDALAERLGFTLHTDEFSSVWSSNF